MGRSVSLRLRPERARAHKNTHQARSETERRRQIATSPTHPNRRSRVSQALHAQEASVTTATPGRRGGGRARASYNSAVNSRRQFLSLLAAAGPLAAASPRQWPQFRGSDSLGTSEDDPRLPDTWSATENVRWKTPLPGMAWASPVVWNNRIFLTNVASEGAVEPVKKGLYFGGDRPSISQDRHIWTACGIEFGTGEIAWKTTLHQGVPPTPRHLKNSYASETPITDGEHVFAHFGYLATWCLDLDGKVVWKRDWKPYRVRNDWGTAASPVLHGGRLYLVNDNEERSTLSCLDKLNGKTIWEVEREEGSNWSTPFVWENDSVAVEEGLALRLGGRPEHRDQHDRNRQGPIL